MKIAVTLPVETYNGLLGRCLLASREYAVLRNGVVSNETDASRSAARVRILCEAEDAQMLFALAARAYPDAISQISKNVDRRNTVAPGIDRNGRSLVHSSCDVEETGEDVYWGEIFPTEHLVQIYEEDDRFMDTLEGFIKGGLQGDDGVIVIAMPAHVAALETRLKVSGLDLEAAQAQDRYISLQAEQVLGRFMVNGSPDDKLFSAVITDLVKRARGNGRNVRAFGEMVALLWERGEEAATIRLEHLWHDLCRAESFSLFCAYPRAGFTRNRAEAISEICAVHSKVIPANSLRAAERARLG